MALTRGGFRHYDYDRVVVLLTMTNAATEEACGISSAAMDDLDRSPGTKPGQQAGHVTVSVSTTKKPIRWTTLAPIGPRSFFSRMRSAEIGIHHHIAGAYLLRYAQERSWRGDNRRLSNGEQVNRLAALSLKRGKSVDFGGYWQRHSKVVHA
jgi:hypothetical protein